MLWCIHENKCISVVVYSIYVYIYKIQETAICVDILLPVHFRMVPFSVQWW